MKTVLFNKLEAIYSSMGLCTILITIWIMLFIWHYTYKRAYTSVLRRIFRYAQKLVDEQKRARYRKTDGRLPHHDSGEDTETIKLNEREIESNSNNNRDRLPISFLLEEELDEREHNFKISDACMFLTHGISAITKDDLVDRFRSCELETWNLLTRKSKRYHFMSLQLTFMWLSSLLWRYIILLPFRIVICANVCCSFLILVVLVGQFPNRVKDRFSKYTITFTLHCAVASATTLLNFHNKQFRPTGSCIGVANHTTPLDVFFLGCDNIYTYVGQLHNGLLGYIMNNFSNVVESILFERKDYKDRSLVRKRLKEVIDSETNKHPLLVFPEGTCVNNTAVLMFKRGSFEICNEVYPVAIKYDSTLADMYWDSKSKGFFRYLLTILTSWAVVCDVYYMPPMKCFENEPCEEFANRVKTEIASKINLRNLQWDGDLKRSVAKKSWTQDQQAEFARRMSRA